MRGTEGNDTTNPCLSRRLCQQKAPVHHALDTEGTVFAMARIKHRKQCTSRRLPLIKYIDQTMVFFPHFKKILYFY